MKMKKIALSLVFVLSAVLYANAGNVRAYLTYAAFNLPGKQPYLETYLSVIGNTTFFVKNGAGKYQGTIDIAIAFIQNGEIKSAQKYTLNSPEIADTTKGYPNFIDQQRYSLANGDYTLEITISDRNDKSGKSFTSKMPVTINFKEGVVNISDIQLVESYVKSASQNVLTKSGYDLLPYVSNLYPDNVTKLKFYAEVYDAKKIVGEGEKLVVNYFIQALETKTKLNEYSAFSKQQANEVNILMAEFNIEKLPTGSYSLVIEVRDKENKIQAEQVCNFDRLNKVAEVSFDDLKSIDISKTFASAYTNIDTLKEYLRCIRPISSTSEVQFAENQIKGNDKLLMQQFFYNFWQSRNPGNAEAEWLLYKKEVQKVNKEFATYGLKGYDTDRGRVYLQYGPPDSRQKFDNEPSAYPYEMWQYNSLVDKTQAHTNPYNKQSNKSFIFYNPDLVSNRYKLLHSNARGEFNNSRWQIDLHKRDTQSGNYDVEKGQDHFGGNVDDNFRNPR
jgi:GWxTD domain-containing protein